MAVLPLSGGAVTVDVDGRRFELAGRDTVFAAVTDWAYLPDRRRGAAVQRRPAPRSRLPSARATRRFDPAMVAGAGRRRRDPRRRPGDAPGHQLHVAGVVRRRRQADVRRAADARRQLVELPAAPSRRQPGVPGEQRGDLLLPHRPRRHHRLRRRTGSRMHRTYTPDGDVDVTVTIGDEDVFRDPARLPRPVRRRARLPAVLPQRPRRPRR